MVGKSLLFSSYIYLQLDENNKVINEKADDGSTPLKLAVDGGFVKVTNVHFPDVYLSKMLNLIHTRRARADTDCTTFVHRVMNVEYISCQAAEQK